MANCLRVLLVAAATTAGASALAQSAATPVSLGERVQFTAANEITRLDRATRRLISTATITATNVGDRPIHAPFLVVVELQSPQGVSQITVDGAIGGVGQAPWQWPYFNFTDRIGVGLAPGQAVSFPLALSRPNGVTLTYHLVAFGCINRDPVAVIDAPLTALANQSIDFSGVNSTDPDGDDLTYVWNFGDGATGSGQVLSHTFASTGPFTVALTVTDPSGASGTATVTVEVTEPANLPPTAVLVAPAVASVGGQVSFDGSGSTDPENGALSYAWNFGDGTTGTGATPQHGFASAATFMISLTVTDPLGASDTATAQLLVQPASNSAPTAVASAPASAGVNQPVPFDGSASSDPDNDSLAFTWNFGDGSTGSGELTQHTFTSTGPFTATLTVTDSHGASDTDTVTVTIQAGPANLPPVAVPVVPALALVNEAIALDGTGSTDPEGEALAYAWDFGDGATGSGAEVSHEFASTGTFVVVLTVTDPHGASDARGLPVIVTPEGTYALARTRVLAGDGQPLEGVITEETGPGGTASLPITFTDGYLSLGGSPGAHTWRFSKPDHVTVWRQAALADRQLSFVPSPWLTPLADETVQLTPLFERRLLADGGVIVVRVPEGAASATADARLTALGPQALPLPLPLGWTPVAAFDLDLGGASLVSPAELVVSPVGAVRAAAPRVLARFDEATLQWIAEVVTDPGASLSVPLTSASVHVLAVPDAAPTAPPAPLPNSPLPSFAGTTPDLSGLTGLAVVEPNPGLASTDPAEVTADVAVLFTSTADVPSGVFLRSDIDETFTLRDGSTIPGAPYDTSVFAYRSPAGGAATAVVAEFPIRPSLALGADVLAEALVHASIQRPDSLIAAIIGADGGSAAIAGLRLEAAAGDFARLGVVELREVDLASLETLLGELPGVRAFDVNLAGMAPDASLTPIFSGLPANTDFLLTRVVRAANHSGLEPVQRLHSDGAGRSRDLESLSGPRLPGIDRAGRYILVRLTAPVGLVTGVGRASGNAPTAGLLARVDGQPWLAITRAGGVFFLVAPSGDGIVRLADDADEDSGEAAFTLADGNATAAVDLALSGAGLLVANVTPAANATNVPVITDVRVRFNRKLDSASFSPNAVVLLDAADTPVSASLALNLAANEATLLPNSPLVFNAAYRIVVDATLSDIAGAALTGPTEFSFTTVTPPVRPAGELVIYEPGAATIPQAVFDRLIGYAPGAGSTQVVAAGGPGVAEGGAVVTLVNLTTGATTTVLAQADGSFADWLSASEEDYVQAVILNRNGTRTAVDATRQIFDDGSVGLYGPGGLLTRLGLDGSYEIEVAPDTVKTRTVFNLTPLTLAEIDAELGGVQPAGGAMIAAGAHLEIRGPMPDGESEVSFPFDPAALNLPPGEVPEDGAFALAIVERIDGDPVFRVVDKMKYANGRLSTASPPFLGVLSGFGPLFDPDFHVKLIVGTYFAAGKPATITGRAVLRLPGEELDFEKTSPVVPGASVFAFKAGASAVGRDRFGRIPGWVYSTTGPDGRYALVVAGDPSSYSVAGTHPRFLDAVSGGLTNVDVLVSRRNLVFFSESETSLQTSLTSSHTPVFPSPGENVTLTVTATQGGNAPLDIDARVTGVLPLVPGVTGSVADVSPPVVVSEEINGGQRRIRYSVSTAKPLRVTLSLTARGETIARRAHVIDFNGVPPLAGGLQSSDPNDRRGPMVTSSFPRPRDSLPAGNPVEVWFDEPVDRSVLQRLDLILLVPGVSTAGAAVNAGPGGRPTADLSDDQRRLRLWFPGLLPGRLFTMILPSSAVRDLANNALDQVPLSRNDPDPFTLTFLAAEQMSTAIPDLLQSRGGVLRGSLLFVGDAARIDDGGLSTGAVRVFDVSQPQAPYPLRDLDALLNQPPTALTMLSSYSFWAKPRGSERQDIAREVRRSDIIAVAGGLVGAGWQAEALTGQPKYLRLLEVIDTGNPDAPVELLPLATSPVHAGDSIITKMIWQPPHLAFLEQWTELGGSITGNGNATVRATSRVSLLNVQEFLRGNQLWLGDNSRPGGEQAELPVTRDPGFDGNGDGDYTDPGDVEPTPSRIPQGFYGFNGAYFSDVFFSNGTQTLFDRSILDFDWSGGLMVGVISDGFAIDSATGLHIGPRLPAQFRVFAAGTNIDPPAGMLDFGLGQVAARPKRVLAVPDILVEVPQPAPPGTLPAIVIETRSLALVSLSPDDDGITRLAVIDVTAPQTPTLVHKIAFPPGFPDTSGLDLLQSMVRRDDGTIALVTGFHTVLLDPGRLLRAVPADPDALHPAVLAVFSGTGTGAYTPVAGNAGLQPVLDRSNNQVVQTAPRMRFVFFPALATGQSAFDLVGSDNDTLRGLFREMQSTENLALARYRAAPTLGVASTLAPASPLVHYHVLIEMPGGGAPGVFLGLRSLDGAGQPLPDPGRGFAPVRYLHPDTLDDLRGQPACPEAAPIVPLLAVRMSDDPASPSFNTYLSEAIAVVAERLNHAETESLRANHRAVISPGHFVEAFIDPAEEDNPVVGAYAATVDRAAHRLRVVATARAQSVPIDYLMGANPPPPGGYAAMPGSDGNVAAHSGEFRHETVDAELPSRRMPIQFRRTLGGQDNYYGPFGRGWDFNYNQRVTQLTPPLFPANLRYPLVERATPEASTVAEAGDVLFKNGEGRILLFKDAGATTPPEFAADPLVQSLGWNNRADRYFLPEPGVFDLLVHFRDGKFARLTPDGVQFWYEPDGRLARIVDRFELNWQELVYTGDGRLRRIVDQTFTDGSRYLEIGYYLSGDPLEESIVGLDRTTPNPRWQRLIAVLRDFAGRQIDFEYDDDGTLLRRLGPAVVADCEDGFSGRSATTYQTNACGDLLGIVAGGFGSETGAPVFASDVEVNPDGAPVVQSGYGISGTVTYGIPVDNSAATNGGAERTATTADGATTSYTYDSNGYVRVSRLAGSNGADAVTETTYNAFGEVERIVYPEGNSVSFTYNDANPVVRSRGNVVAIGKNPGPRGGPVITTSHHFDDWYNLTEGDQEDENGDRHSYALTADRRAIDQIAHGTDAITDQDYNDWGQLVREATPDGRVRQYFFGNDTGYLEREIRGEMTLEYFYDGSVAAQLGMATRIEPPLREPIVRRYDSRLLLIEEQRGDALQRKCYDENGNPVRIEIALEPGVTRVETRRYLQSGFMQEHTIHDVETDGSPISLTTVYVPDALNRVSSLVYPGGETGTYTYDHHGRVVRWQLGDYVEEYELNRHGHLVRLRKGGDVVVEHTLDGYDRVIEERRFIHPGSASAVHAATMTYFDRGEVRSRRVQDTAFGLVSGFDVMDVDAIGRPRGVQQIGTTINPLQTTTYETGIGGGLTVTSVGPRETLMEASDASGLPATSTNSIGTVTHVYDANQKLESQTSVEDGIAHTVGIVRNELDQPVTYADDLGRIATLVPRLDDQVLASTDARGHTTNFTFSRLGEPLTARRPSGVGFHYRYNRSRQPAFVGELVGPPDGTSLGYDASLRKTGETTRDGGSRTFSQFDGRAMPAEVQFPGGTAGMVFDLQGRPAEATVNYVGNRVFSAAFVYDGQDRMRDVTFGPGINREHRQTFVFDAAGPLLSTTLSTDAGSFTSSATLYADGARSSLEYPSAVEVAEARQPSGRLEGLAVNGDALLTITEFAGAGQPRLMELGRGPGVEAALRREDSYDLRRRLVRTHYVQTGTGATLADIRYEYDATDNPTARQWIHRSGRTDFFSYDGDNRLETAHYAARPAQPTEAARTLVGVVAPGAGFATGAFGRAYTFDSGNRDLVESATLVNPDGAPAFNCAQSQTGHDEFLFARSVDGVQRSAPDPLGNAAQTRLQVRPDAAGAAGPVTTNAQLSYDGLSRLVRVEREDGVAIDYEYTPENLLLRKRVTESAGVQLVSDRVFVWCEGRLLEEWEQTPSGRGLAARYYYADGDSPIAADLLVDGQLERVFYLTDAQKSVIAVTDDQGNVVERISYDAYGEPRVELADSTAPAVAQIQRHADGLLIVFTEPVLPRLQNIDAIGLETQTVPLGTSVDIVGHTGQLSLAENAAGVPFGHTIFFQGSIAVGSSVTVRIAGNALEDEWGNAAAPAEFTFTYAGAPGIALVTGPGVGSTGGATVSRSVIGNPILFHGQYYDYDVGLLYLRNRHYDPFTGTFLQRDPAGYADSVNPYCAFRNNPVRFRDPNGDLVIIIPVIEIIEVAFAVYAAYEASKAIQEFAEKPSLETAGKAALHTLDAVVSVAGLPGAARVVAGAVTWLSRSRKAGRAVTSIVGKTDEIYELATRGRNLNRVASSVRGGAAPARNYVDVMAGGRRPRTMLKGVPNPSVRMSGSDVFNLAHVDDALFANVVRAARKEEPFFAASGSKLWPPVTEPGAVQVFLHGTESGAAVVRRAAGSAPGIGIEFERVVELMRANGYNNEPIVLLMCNGARKKNLAQYLSETFQTTVYGATGFIGYGARNQITSIGMLVKKGSPIHNNATPWLKYKNGIQDPLGP